MYKISLPTDNRLPWMIRFAYHSCNKNKIYKSKCKSGFSWTRRWYLVQFINITIPKMKVKFIQLNYYWLFLNIVFIQVFCENTGKVSSWHVLMIQKNSKIINMPSKSMSFDRPGHLWLLANHQHLENLGHPVMIRQDINYCKSNK